MSEKRTLVKRGIFTITALLTLAGQAMAYSSSYSARPGAVFDFQSLLTLIQSQHVNSVDQLVTVLPESYKKNFTLMFQSKSIQAASPEFPRVISFGDYGNLDPALGGKNNDHLYLAFETNPQSPTGNTLEVIEWMPQTKSYQFHQIDFPMTPTSVTTNPTSCTACHGTPLRPNWSAYPRWDGAVGNHNGLTGSFNVDPFAATQEQAHALFNKLQANDDRLKPLNFDEFFTQTFEYPNSFLSDKIDSQLKARDVELIREQPSFRQFKYALAGAFMECSNFSDFFSPSVLKSLQQGVFDNLGNVPRTSDDVMTADALTFDQLLKMTAPLVERDGVHFGELYPGELYTTTWLRFLFEGTRQATFFRNLLGNPMNKTSLDSSWTYDFVGFTSRVTGLSQSFLDKMNSSNEIVPDDPTMELSINLALQSDSGGPITIEETSGRSCQKLAALSQKATAHYAPPRVLTQIPSRTQPAGLFKKYCSLCHTSGAHILPLDDQDALQLYRTKAGKSIAERLFNQEMPPADAPAYPTDTERAQMVDWVK